MNTVLAVALSCCETGPDRNVFCCLQRVWVWEAGAGAWAWMREGPGLFMATSGLTPATYQAYLSTSNRAAYLTLDARLLLGLRPEEA